MRKVAVIESVNCLWLLRSMVVVVTYALHIDETMMRSIE